MRNLFTTWYDCGNAERQAELDHCLLANANSGLFDKIITYGLYYQKFDNHPKIVCLDCTSVKPTYQRFITAINTYEWSENAINIIANTDIIFDETIKLADNMGVNDCYALSRWELKPDYTKHLTQIQVFGDSQDSWIFKGKIKPMEYCDFPIGTRGCDNRIAYEIQKAGYKITNPSKSIHTWHLHNSGVRDYTPGKGYAVPEPYLNVPIRML